MLYCAPCQFPYSRKPDVSSKMSDNQQNQLWGGRFSAVSYTHLTLPTTPYV